MPTTAKGSVPHRPRRQGPPSVPLWRWVAVLALLGAATAMVAVLYTGISSRGLRLAIFLMVCAAGAGLVALLPIEFRKRVGLPVSAFVAVAGLLPLFIAQGSDQESDKPRTVNVDYAAELLARGPFTGDVPPPLKLTSMKEEFADEGSATTQLALDFAFPRSYGFGGANAYLFLFASSEQGGTVAAERQEVLGRQYAEFGETQGGPNGFFQFANGEIIGGGARDYLFCESSIYPDSNANIALLQNLISACLNHGEQVLRLASSD